ncbi:interferon alpha-inducible protein 27, mitochondrial-like isoform X6 [Lampetra planeri]
MTSQWMATLVMATILGISLGPVVAKKETSTYWWNFCAEKKSTNWWNFCAEEELTILCYVGVLALGGVVVVDLTPLAIRAMGFTAEGIVAGSMAAWLMAREAAANGGGVVDGGVVATLQSIGVAGLSIPAKIIVWTAGVAITKVVVDICCCVLKHL